MPLNRATAAATEAVLVPLPRFRRVAARRITHVGNVPRVNLFRRITGVLEDAGLLLLGVLLLPFAIMLVGAPVALFLWLVIEIVHRVL